MKITRELLRQWDDCYTDEKIAKLVPVAGLDPVQVADMEAVPVDDRIWVLLRRKVLGDSLPSVVAKIVERAIRRVLGNSGVPEWEIWALAWLAGERGRDLAMVAADAATRDSAWAAWAAARAAARAADGSFWGAASDCSFVARATVMAAAWAATNEEVEQTTQLSDIVAALG